MRFNLLVAFMSIFIFMNTTANAAELSKADVENIVKEYIANNGKALSLSLDRYITQAQRDAANSTIMDHSPSIGGSDTLVTFIEYGDYRCGYCKRVQKDILKLRKEYKGKVKFAFKFLPILSEESRIAAMAALAAHKQGKFWEYHEKMWDNQTRLGEGDALFVKVAEEIDLDMKRFNKDRASTAIEAEIYDDISDARVLGIRGTPYFVIDGEGQAGARGYKDFVKLLDAAIAAAQQ